MKPNQTAISKDETRDVTFEDSKDQMALDEEKKANPPILTSSLQNDEIKGCLDDFTQNEGKPDTFSQVPQNEVQ